MATTLTAGQEALTYFSFPIEKTEDTAEVSPLDGTPDIWIWGKATDGTVDGDREIVDPEWSAKALTQWCDTGGNVRMAHDPKKPVGKGHQVHVTADGHYVRSLICEPVAKHLIRQKVLNDYSVGISNPDFRYGDRKLDPEGKALRVITGKTDGSSRIAELSVVDRGSNFNSRFQMVKSAGGGFTGEMVGDADEIAKAAPAELVKAARADDDAPVTVDVPKSATITFSPADLNKLLEHRRIAEEREAEALKAIAAAEAPVYKRDINTATRRRLAGQGRALPNLSYPVETHEDAENAVTLILSGHGDTGAARRMVMRIARKEGWQDILNRLSGKKKPKKEKGVATDDTADKGTAAMPPAAPETPAVAKDDGGDPKEPVLHHDDGQDDDTDSDADAMDKAASLKADMPAGKKPKVPCPKCKAMCKPGAKFCGKCGCSMKAEKASKPTPGEGVTGAAASDINPVPEHREPDGPAIEALEHDAHLPTVPDASVKTAMHLRTLGVPLEQGRLHGLLCPAYTDESVKAAWPGADLSLIDDQLWQAKALETAASAPLDEAQKATQVWTAAWMLKSVTPDLHADIMTEARKAFRDANPGPGSAPTPGELSAQRFNRPYITAGHAATSPGHDAPHRDPVHAGHISASDFTRDIITAGHAADSPENDPGHPIPVGAPEVPGVPSRVFYTRVQRQNAQQAMRAMHDHIAATFPDLCPMHGPGHMGEQPSHARPVPVGVGGPMPHGASTKADAPPGYDGVIDTGAALIAAKAAKKERRRLEKAALAGDETAWTALGLPLPAFAAKAAIPGEAVTLDAAPLIDPQVIKTAVAEATAPLVEKLAATETALAEQRRIIDAIADQPDPAVTAYRGAAIAKTSVAAPAGPMGLSQRAELAQDNLVRELFATAKNSPDPTLRTEAWEHLMTIHGITGSPSMRT